MKSINAEAERRRGFLLHPSVFRLHNFHEEGCHAYLFYLWFAAAGWGCVL